jgi:dolichol-phosphate mannosyltransferase
VFNEARNVTAIVKSLHEVLTGVDWEVVFVDDDSPDGTAEVVRALALSDDKVRLILRVGDRGLSKSCIQGLLSGRAEILCVMDGDGQHGAEVIPDLVAPLRSGVADIVSAARQLDCMASSALSPLRKRLSLAGNYICRLLLHRDVTDPLTGFFALNRHALLSVVRKLDDSGFKILLTILAADRTLRHREVPFTFGERLHGESKLDSFTFWQFFTYLLSRLVGGLIPARAISFVLVGLFGLFVHFSILYPALWLGATFSEAQLSAALVAITSNYLLNNWLTFRDRRLAGRDLALGYLWFLTISVVGLAANVAIATLAFEKLHGMAAISAMAGIAIDTVWKFVVSSRLVWPWPRSRSIPA